MRASAWQVAEATSRPADRHARKAHARWFHGFADEIQCHHHIEDELLFPAIADSCCDLSGDRPELEGDHADLDVLLDDLRATLAASDEGRAASLAAELRDHLDERFAFEDAEIALHPALHGGRVRRPERPGGEDDASWSACSSRRRG